MTRLRTSQIELALQVQEGRLHVKHGHFGLQVSEQLHHGEQTDACPDHLCAEGVPQLVRDNPPGDPNGGDDVAPVITELAYERVAPVGAGQKKAVGREGIVGTQQAEAIHQTGERKNPPGPSARFSTCRGAHG